jgi:signal transduction histidine kinase
LATSLSVENPSHANRRELARIVHDFNNLLGVALNFAILAREKLGPAAADPGAGAQVQQAVGYLERVERAAREAVKLNKELAALARPGEQPIQP